MKQAILIRDDLKLPKGKASAQAAHASVEAAFKCNNTLFNKWRNEGMAKIVLKVKDEKELVSYFQKAKDAGLAVSLVTDAGKTVVEPGTMTAAAIGPDEDEKVDKISGKLKLY